MAVDPELRVHVTFEGKSGECEGGARLDYAYRPADGGWTVEAHVVYRRELDSGLYYAYRDPNMQSWAEELVAAGSFSNTVGQSAKIEIDAFGDVHVFTQASGGPRYLYRAAGSDDWDSEVVDASPFAGR